MTRPRAKSIIVFCHRPDHYLRKQFVRFGNGRRKVEYVLEPTGAVVREKFALEAIAELSPRDFDLFGQAQTWTASKAR